MFFDKRIERRGVDDKRAEEGNDDDDDDDDDDDEKEGLETLMPVRLNSAQTFFENGVKMSTEGKSYSFTLKTCPSDPPILLDDDPVIASNEG
ncbi:hypothetical protein ElyMa_004502900 [Elysia marginata]|uniref:Uncharacterized protein n=1 Tax=Elysia marginata TaxID=1093978 RepID=A0AAV4HN40_9GAST|nr:hypothetical protein ElyMa_004502900 [Elysia marginata]